MWNVTGWQRPYQRGNDLPTLTRARCGDTVLVSCAPGVTAGIYRMSDPSGFCPPRFDRGTGQALSPVMPGCKANVTITAADKGFFLTSQAPGDCKAGVRMGVKIPRCSPPAVGYAVAPTAAKVKNATAPGAVMTFNLTKAAAAAGVANGTAAANGTGAAAAPAAALASGAAARASATAMLVAVVAAVAGAIVA